MAITSVSEIWQGRDGEANASPAAITYSRVFRVVTDNQYDTAALIMSSALLPPIGGVFPGDARATCRRIRPRQESFSPKIWIVTCAYSTEQSNAPSDDPLNDPVSIKWSTEAYQEVVTKDRDGNAIVNSAGDPPEGGFDIDDPRVVATATKNVASVPDWIWQYRRAVNSTPFGLSGLTIQAGFARVMHLGVSEQQWRNDIPFYKMQTTIAISDDGWNIHLLDQGFRQIDPQNSFQRLKIVSDDGTDVTAPVLLDGNGQPLADPQKDNAVFIQYPVYPALDFNNLAIF